MVSGWSAAGLAVPLVAVRLLHSYTAQRSCCSALASLVDLLHYACGWAPTSSPDSPDDFLPLPSPPLPPPPSPHPSLALPLPPPLTRLLLSPPSPASFCTPMTCYLSLSPVRQRNCQHPSLISPPSIPHLPPCTHTLPPSIPSGTLAWAGRAQPGTGVGPPLLCLGSVYSGNATICLPSLPPGPFRWAGPLF